MHRVERDRTIRMLQRQPVNWKMALYFFMLAVSFRFRSQRVHSPEATADLDLS